ncbi:hypothetical protein Ddc_13265 [Ditylenchus destructor]|nr:hypothetical protein Ddc_13265 [Ditylenchus destructor]
MLDTVYIRQMLSTLALKMSHGYLQTPKIEMAQEMTEKLTNFYITVFICMIILQISHSPQPEATPQKKETALERSNRLKAQFPDQLLRLKNFCALQDRILHHIRCDSTKVVLIPLDESRDGSFSKTLMDSQKKCLGECCPLAHSTLPIVPVVQKYQVANYAQQLLNHVWFMIGNVNTSIADEQTYLHVNKNHNDIEELLRCTKHYHDSLGEGTFFSNAQNKIADAPHYKYNFNTDLIQKIINVQIN